MEIKQNFQSHCRLLPHWGSTPFSQLRSNHSGQWRTCVSWLSHTSTNTTFQSRRLLFSHASAEVRGENTAERKFTSTGSRTQNHQVMSPTRSRLSYPDGALNFWRSKKEHDPVKSGIMKWLRNNKHLCHSDCFIGAKGIWTSQNWINEWLGNNKHLSDQDCGKHLGVQSSLWFSVILIFQRELSAPGMMRQWLLAVVWLLWRSGSTL